MRTMQASAISIGQSCVFRRQCVDGGHVVREGKAGIEDEVTALDEGENGIWCWEKARGFHEHGITGEKGREARERIKRPVVEAVAAIEQCDDQTGVGNLFQCGRVLCRNRDSRTRAFVAGCSSSS